MVVECPRPAPPCLTLAPPLPALECAPISRAPPPLPLPPSLSTPSRPSLPPFEPPAVLMRVPTRCPPVPRFPHCSESGCRTPAVNPQPPKEEATGGVGWSRGGGGSTCERLPSPYHPAPPRRGPNPSLLPTSGPLGLIYPRGAVGRGVSPHSAIGCRLVNRISGRGWWRAPKPQLPPTPPPPPPPKATTTYQSPHLPPRVGRAGQAGGHMGDQRVRRRGACAGGGHRGVGGGGDRPAASTRPEAGVRGCPRERMGV